MAEGGKYLNMKYWELLKEENEAVAERHELAMERIGHMKEEATVGEPYRAFFERTVQFIELIEETFQKQMDGTLATMSQEEAAEFNRTLYADILPGAYGKSFANPDYAAKELGEDYGPWLSFLYTEIRSAIVYAYESRLVDVTVLEELFIEVYNLFEDGTPEVAELREPLYYFVSDYCDRMLPWRVRETLDPSLDFGKSIIMDSDLNDLRYLYRFGEYISETELATARFMNELPEETVRRMADTYTEGYRKGFAATGRSYEGKKTVQIRYHIGFERMIRMAVENFRELGLEPIIARASIGTVNRMAARTNGYYGTPANRQYEYDHRYDNAVYLDKAFRERKLSILKVAYETYKDLASVYAGPAVVETFGEAGFEPVNVAAAFSLSEKQEKLLLSYSNEAMQIVDAYIPGTETSFTIIAFPLPEIGAEFEAIFKETIRINTLDYELYRDIQQIMINELDQASQVHISGRGGNRTDLTVQLHTLAEPTKQSNFENCVADVNIPVGEVFTSPKLTGTEGVLHVPQTFLRGMQYNDLELQFRDGMITKYTCRNFEKEAENEKLLQDGVLYHHDTLPIGEFAIGTNTTAYMVARRYEINDKLPVLIAEKTGPHFAVGDTCYSYEEDRMTYNPDGKAIIARDNEVSALRHTDPEKAYFNCHTDITIPYAELAEVTAVCADGTRIGLIKDGFFVLDGTEELNLPLYQG